MIKLQDSGIYDILPFNVKSANIEVQALSYAVQQAILMICQFSNGVRVMTCIDDMPESIIDNLAVELNLPCYHSESMLNVKRALVKDAFIWHTIAGTASAIRRYFSTISQNTDIQEWFDYGGNPYHFRIVAAVAEGQEISEEMLKDIGIQIERLKNARSILDEALVVKEHNHNAAQCLALCTAEIKERSLGEYQGSSYWLDKENGTIFLSSNNDDIFSDKNGNIFAI